MDFLALDPDDGTRYSKSGKLGTWPRYWWMRLNWPKHWDRRLCDFAALDVLRISQETEISRKQNSVIARHVIALLVPRDLINDYPIRGPPRGSGTFSAS